MQKATISKLKNNLSAYLRRVRAGQPVVIYDRDVPIARIERIESAGGTTDRLTSLGSQGAVRPPKHALLAEKLRSRSRAVSADVLGALLEARDADR
jgi:prevent-host-death family protein